MKTRTIIFAMSVLFVLSLSGCAGNRQETEYDDAKKAYEEPWNKVGTIVLEERDFKRELISNGKLSAISKSALTFGVSGTITDIRISNGDYVSRDDTIAVIERESKKIELDNAEIELERCRIEMQDIIAGYGYSPQDKDVPENIRSMAGIRSGYLSASNNLERVRNEYDACVMKAPFSGRIADLKANEYDPVPSDAFCKLIDDSRFNVNFNILESEYGFVEKGLDVKVIPFGDNSGNVFRGHITNINPTVDKNGQISVNAVIDNPGKLIDGMNVRVIIEKNVPGQLVVPKSAVVIRDNLEVLFVYSSGTARWTYVNTLMSNSSSYAVEANRERHSELRAGDTVIVSGNLNLADGSKVVIKD